jgi:hypothetical protein
MNADFLQRELLALRLSRLGQPERLPLSWPQPDEAKGVRADPSDLLEVRSDVLAAVDLEAQLDPARLVLHVRARHDQPFLIRAAHPGTAPRVQPDALATEIPLRQIGRFVIESVGGAPLALVGVERDALVLVLVGQWDAPPLRDWIREMDDDWMRAQIEGTAASADTWTRTALAGQIARLTEVGRPHRPAATASALLRHVSLQPGMLPRLWIQTLDSSALASLEQHASRRAAVLEDDLEGLFTALSADGHEAEDTWTRLCHRRDDLEGVRVLLHQAGKGDELDRVLQQTDLVGRAVRLSLVHTSWGDDERLRRVALGDAGAWWGSTAFDVRLI